MRPNFFHQISTFSGQQINLDTTVWIPKILYTATIKGLTGREIELLTFIDSTYHSLERSYHHFFLGLQKLCMYWPLTPCLPPMLPNCFLKFRHFLIIKLIWKQNVGF